MIRHTVAFYLFIYCVFYDYFKYPNSFNGIQINQYDLLQIMTIFILAMLSVHAILKNIKSRVPHSKIVIFSMAGVYVLTWALSILTYDAAYTPSQASIDRSLLRVNSIYEFINLGKFCVGYIILPSLLANHLKFVDLRKVVYMAGIVHLIWGIGQILYFLDIVPIAIFPIGVGGRVDDHTFNYVYGRSSGLLENPFNYAFFMQFAALLALFSNAYSRRRSDLIYFFLFFFGSLLSINRTTFALWVFFFLIQFISLQKRNQRLKILMAGIVGLGLLFSVAFADQILTIIERRFNSDTSLSTRAEAYKMAVSSISIRPLLGIGTGHGVITDSSVSTLLIERGIIGFIGWLSFWCALIWVSLRRIERNGIDPGSRTLFWMPALILLGSALIGSAERHPVMLVVVLLAFVQCKAVHASQHINGEKIRKKCSAIAFNWA